jgi:hypothetical protein
MNTEDFIDLCTANEPRPTNGRPEIEANKSAWQVIVHANINSIHGRTFTILIFCLVVLTAMTAGCGSGDRPQLGNVQGRVTLDGKPLVHAMLRFHPTSQGRESFGTTDTDGRYELSYIRDIKGAKVDLHTVYIATGDVSVGIPEILPEKYNVKSELKREVKGGENEIDFDLKSK